MRSKPRRSSRKRQTTDDAPLAMRLRELQTYTQIAAEGNTILIPANMTADMPMSVALMRRQFRERRSGVMDGQKTEGKCSHPTRQRKKQGPVEG